MGETDYSRRNLLKLGSLLAIGGLIKPKHSLSQILLEDSPLKNAVLESLYPDSPLLTQDEIVCLRNPHVYNARTGKVFFNPPLKKEDKERFWYAKRKQLDIAGKYSDIIYTVEEKRKEIIKTHIFSNPTEIIKASREEIENTFKNLISPLWLGTPWNMYGNTEQPQKPSIACGYFSERIMLALGFELFSRNPKVKLGQQTYRNIMNTFVNDTDLIHFTAGLKLEKFISRLTNLPEGLYLIGLDSHGGFIFNKRDNIKFIHSTMLPPEAVVCQDAETSQSLECSNTKIMCPLLSDDMVTHWKNREPYEIVESKPKTSS